MYIATFAKIWRLLIQKDVQLGYWLHLPLGLGVNVVRLVDYHAGQVVAAASKSNSGRALQALPPVHVLLPGYIRHLSCRKPNKLFTLEFCCKNSAEKVALAIYTNWLIGSIVAYSLWLWWKDWKTSRDLPKFVHAILIVLISPIKSGNFFPGWNNYPSIWFFFLDFEGKSVGTSFSFINS